jgi:hypothetical protein
MLRVNRIALGCHAKCFQCISASSLRPSLEIPVRLCGIPSAVRAVRKRTLIVLRAKLPKRVTSRRTYFNMKKEIGA